MLNLYWIYYFAVVALMVLALYGLLKFAFLKVQNEFATIKRIIEKSPLK